MKLLFLSLMAWACTQPQSPISVEPAAKVLIDPSSVAVEWSCGTDSVWSVFNGNFTFHIDGDEIAVRERPAQGRTTRHRTHDATIAYNEGSCALRSGFVSADSVTRIFKGYVWRDKIFRYYFQDEGGSYRINNRYVDSDGGYTPPFEVVRYRDFNSFWNEDDPRPAEGLTQVDHRGYSRYYHLYYLPVNFSAAALDTLQEIPKDDRPYLVDPIVEVEPLEFVVIIDEEEPSGSTGSSSGSSSSSSTGGSSTGSTGSSSGSSSSPSTGGSTTGSSSGTGSQGNQNSGNQNSDPDPGDEDDYLSLSASLNYLTISPGTLSPAFSPHTFSYSATVAEEVESVTVSAGSSDPKAQVTISGGSDLSFGVNTISVTSVSEGGFAFRYAISITREGTPPPPPEPEPEPTPPPTVTSSDYIKIRTCSKEGGRRVWSITERHYSDGSCKRYECGTLVASGCKNGSSTPSFTGTQCAHALNYGAVGTACTQMGGTSDFFGRVSVPSAAQCNVPWRDSHCP